MRATPTRARPPRAVLLALALLLGTAGLARADVLQMRSPEACRLASEGLEALHSCDHERAGTLLTGLVDENPDEPLGWLLRIKACWWGIVEGRDADGELERRMQADFARLRDLDETRLERDPHDVLALYTLGEAHCTLGRLEGIRGHGWPTLRLHQKGIGLLRAALDVNPDLVEPLASVGVCHYYAARLPGFLRFLGRFLRLPADRQGGLRELRRAATVGGVQQAEAAFFLLQILNETEDENLEALPIAQRFHSRYPHNVAFTTKLADVDVALERPDLAVRLLTGAASDTSDACSWVQSRFFLARIDCWTGRAAEGLALLETLSPRDLRYVTWLGPWRAMYMGLADAELGRPVEARAQFELTLDAPEIADSHSFAKREASRAEDALHWASLRARTSLAWGGDAAGIHAELEAALLTAPAPSALSISEAHYVLGLAALRQGNSAEAAQAFARAAASCDEADEAWLAARPRVRLLQALQWSGRIEEAQRWAGHFEPKLNDWGSNVHLGLLVKSCLQPSPPSPPVVVAAAGRPGDRPVRFELRDVGFTSVSLLRFGSRHPEPMRAVDGAWRLDVPLPPGPTFYVFEVEGRARLLDPESSEVEERDGKIWSVRHPPAGRES